MRDIFNSLDEDGFLPDGLIEQMRKKPLEVQDQIEHKFKSMESPLYRR